MVTYQNSLDPTELDHSFGLGGLLGCRLLSRRHIIAVGKTILKWLLENKPKMTFMNKDATGIKEHGVRDSDSYSLSLQYICIQTPKTDPCGV